MKIEKSITISSNPAQIWRHLTEPQLMENWIGEPEMNIKVQTDWIVGSPITIRGFHHTNFLNTGKVIAFEPQRLLSYSQLSSLSKLPDLPKNHTLISFLLKPLEETTTLTVSLENFPTETIYHHLDFYWRGTIHVLRNQIEKVSNYRS